MIGEPKYKLGFQFASNENKLVPKGHFNTSSSNN
jgi:hypothetical protein